jgi:type II secretory pathway component PulM
MALRNELHTLPGVYALDALDPGAELDRFERHLTRCSSCAGEVRGFRETAARLGFAVAERPPATLRGSVMAAVARTRQLPAVDEHARHARSGPRRRPVPAWRPLPRLALAGAALGLVAAVVLGVLYANTENQLTQVQRQLTQAQAQLQAITAVRTAVDARVITKPTSIGGTVTVVTSPSRHQMVLTTSGLPPPATGKVYQLWLIGVSHVHPIRAEGVLVPQRGRAGPVLVSGVLRGDVFGITLEPKGGTAQPTVTPIVGVPLPS